MQEEPRIVPLGVDNAPKPKSEAQDARLEEMLKIANIMSEQNNNQSGTGKKNSSKAIRAERRAKKLARKKQRYR